MLGRFQHHFGQVKPPRTIPAKVVAAVEVDPPRLLVSVHISRSTLSLSRPATSPTRITLLAQVEGMEPVTVHTHGSLLDSRTPAMFYDGFTFRDTATGQFSRRLTINFCTFDNYVDPGRQEIPPVMSNDPPFEFEHGLAVPSFLDTWESGFEVGHTYEVGFSPRGGRISWWRMGKKSAVYPSGEEMPQGKDCQGREWLDFVPLNNATFTVVE